MKTVPGIAVKVKNYEDKMEEENQEKTRKLRHDSISDISVHEISVSLENDTTYGGLYKPVVESDPAIIALAKDMLARGQLEPIVLTTDRFILSGHRRFAAAKLAGFQTVRCRFDDIAHDDPNFLPRLRAYNAQREKSADEKFHEEMVSMNPDEAHRLLVEHRKAAGKVNVKGIKIVGKKSRSKISKNKKPFLDAVLKVIEGLKDFLPISDRQIHYGLLNAPPLIFTGKPKSRYRNDRASYQALTDILTRARLAGFINWHVIADPTRPVTNWRVYPTTTHFIREQLDGFMKGFYRDYLVSQPNHIEIIGEKNTILGTIRPVAQEYCIPVTIGRGFCSLAPRYEMAQRFRKSGKATLLLLILSDHDPAGCEIAHSFVRSLRDDFLIENLKAIRVALTPEQVIKLQLPPIMKAKKSDSNYKKFVKKHGEDVFELEAIKPAKMQEILRQAIDSVIDIDRYNAEVDAEKKDAAYLHAIRRTIKSTLPHIDGLDTEGEVA